MKTIRLTWIALSIAALLVVAIAPAASAACSGTACNKNLKGTYAFRLDPATGFDANLANDGDPGNVSGALRQNVTRAGQFTANGLTSGLITGGETFATTDDDSGNTYLIDYTWTGPYTVTSDLTGTLTINPDSSSSWKCYDMTNPAGPPDWTPVTSYLSWPNQIMPAVSNAGSFVYQPVTAPDWVKSSYYRNLYTSSVQIFPTVGNSGNNAFRRSPVEGWFASTPYPLGYQILPAAANNAGGYLYQVTTAGTSGATEPATFNQTVAGTQTDGTVVWTNENGILGKTGATEPATWPAAVVGFASGVGCTGNAAPYGCCTAANKGTCPVAGGFTTDGGIMWINEGPVGTSTLSANTTCTAPGAPAQCCTNVGQGSCAEPSWAQTGQITNDGGVTWAFKGNSPLTPIACTSTWEPTTETYSTSLSLSHGALEMVETDNAGGGAKIFMTGEAVKRP